MKNLTAFLYVKIQLFSERQMIGRVLSPSMQSMYDKTFDKKPINRVRGANLSLWSTTTGEHYSTTPRTLYQTDIEEPAHHTKYVRPQSAKMELVKLPEEYRSTVKPKLDPQEPTTTYIHSFGACGEQRVVKRADHTTIRQLSKQTQADINGTPKISHYPPGYSGHIPYTWKANRGKQPREDKDLYDLTYQYHTNTTGYGGYVPTLGMDSDLSNQKHTPTTYRDMCAAVEKK